MSVRDIHPHRVAAQRVARGWSQLDLARRADVSRSSVSAIESARLVPSVATALALARALECSVEELFGDGKVSSPVSKAEWAWRPSVEPSRYWAAEVGGQRWRYPVETQSWSATAHDGLWRGEESSEPDPSVAEQTLVMACCDPAAAWLAREYAQASGFRLIVFARGGGAALDLLRRGVVHVAGLHRATDTHPDLNAETVRAEVGEGHRLLRAARWQEGFAMAAAGRPRSVDALLRRTRRWALREPGSAARECLESVRGNRRLSGRVVAGHAAVAEAVRAGWADAGVCVRLVADEAGLDFLPLRTEMLDFCFADALTHDPRIQALVRVVRSRTHRRLVSELPGYDAGETGEMQRV